jgi:hypothetical protein
VRDAGEDNEAILLAAQLERPPKPGASGKLEHV